MMVYATTNQTVHGGSTWQDNCFSGKSIWEQKLQRNIALEVLETGVTRLSQAFLLLP